jgi:aromatic ring-opening dioxygenase catalytic subunit (LigB family)
MNVMMPVIFVSHGAPMLVAAGASYDSTGMKIHKEFAY